MDEHQPALAAGPAQAGATRRSLVLAGGGMRVSYQAGALLALAERGLRFHHADGTSGGTFNLAMLLSGLSPQAMCDRWRALPPRDFVSLLPLPDYFERLEQAALGDGRGVVEKVFPQLGIDLDRIRAARGIDGTFNVCNFTRKRNRAVPHTEASVPQLLAGVSLPIFMPPVDIDGELYTDSVWIKDANLMEAVRRGAEEIWLVWCIGNSAPYRPGAFNQYVHMIEMSANGVLFEEFDAIADLNERIARGEQAYGQTRPIRLHVVKPDWPLPLDPELYLDRIDNATLIDMGYADARRYLDRLPPDGVPLAPEATRMRTPRPGAAFRETWHGRLAAADGGPHPLAGADLALHAAINVRDTAAFVAGPVREGDLYAHVDPAADACLVTAGGTWHCDTARDDPALGPHARRLRYRLRFDAQGRPWCLAASRTIDAAQGAVGLLRQAGQLHVRLHPGADDAVPAVAEGVFTAGWRDVLHTAESVSATNVDAVGAAARSLAEFVAFLGGAAG
jgi:predicted patatin/cPLA2 family phospholipase